MQGRMWMPILEIFQVMECLFAVEDPDVLRLGRGQAADCPAEVHEVGLDRRVERVHADLARKVVRLAGVAGTAGRDDVGPVVSAAAREGDQVVAGERLAGLELDLQPTAILAAVAIAREQEGVRYLATEAPGDVD